MTIEPRTMLNSPIAIFVLGTFVLISGNWLTDRLKTTNETSAEVVKLEAVDRRVTALQAQVADYEHDGLTAQQFNEFRTAQDRRLDDLRDDVKYLTSEVNSTFHLRPR